MLPVYIENNLFGGQNFQNIVLIWANEGVLETKLIRPKV